MWPSEAGFDKPPAPSCPKRTNKRTDCLVDLGFSGKRALGRAGTWARDRHRGPVNLPAEGDVPMALRADDRRRTPTSLGPPPKSRLPRAGCGGPKPPKSRSPPSLRLNGVMSLVLPSQTRGEACSLVPSENAPSARTSAPRAPTQFLPGSTRVDQAVWAWANEVLQD